MAFVCTHKKMKPENHEIVCVTTYPSCTCCPTLYAIINYFYNSFCSPLLLLLVLADNGENFSQLAELSGTLVKVHSDVRIETRPSSVLKHDNGHP